MRFCRCVRVSYVIEQVQLGGILYQLTHVLDPEHPVDLAALGQELTTSHARVRHVLVLLTPSNVCVCMH